MWTTISSYDMLQMRLYTRVIVGWYGDMSHSVFISGNIVSILYTLYLTLKRIFLNYYDIINSQTHYLQFFISYSLILWKYNSS